MVYIISSFPLAYDQIHLFDNKSIHCYVWYLIQHKLTKILLSSRVLHACHVGTITDGHGESRINQKNIKFVSNITI